MKTQLAQNVRERLAIISDDITKMDGFFKSPDDITKIVGQSCVPCKPLCCPPTLLTLPLKIRVPPANATHLYIIILQLLNILITSYGKYQILPNPHNTAQFNHACPAAAQFNYACPATAQFNYACPATAQFNHACPATAQFSPATAQFNYACPATAQFNYVCPATAQFYHACPATAQFNHACPATAQFNYACPATAQFNSRTLLSSSCQPL